jgi:DNA topoisomerase I
MPRLRGIDWALPAISRRRRGRGFEYLDESGERIEDPDILERIRALAVPPAWEDVWICADPLGHIQATGVDARGRKQYRYHDLWRGGGTVRSSRRWSTSPECTGTRVM